MRLKNKIRGWLCLLLVLGCLWASGPRGLAAGSVNVTAQYTYRGTDLDGTTVRLYYVAALEKDTHTFTPEPPYSEVCTEAALADMATARGNRTLAETLIALIDSRGMEATVSGVTEAGRVRFTGLAEGLYLLRSDCPEGYSAEQAVVCLPQWDEASGVWLDEVSITAKLSAAQPVAPTTETRDALPEGPDAPEDAAEDAAGDETPEGGGLWTLLEDLFSSDTPLGNFIGGLRGNGWALVNLICTILTALIALGMVYTFCKKPKENEEEEQAEAVQAAESNPEDDGEAEQQKRRKSKFFGLLPAVLAVITFILTEDMRQPMGLVDKWTLLMVLYLVLNGLLAYLTRRKKPDEEDAETPTEKQ